MRNVGFVLRRELAAYFATPLAYIFIVIFSGAGRHPDLFRRIFGARPPTCRLSLVSILAVPVFGAGLSMRLWAEERRTGSIELLLTMPITMSQAVVGKYSAAWLFTGIALLLTAPIWSPSTISGRPTMA